MILSALRAASNIVQQDNGATIKINTELVAVVLSCALLGLTALFTWLVKQVIKMGQIMVRLEDRVLMLERGTHSSPSTRSN